MRCDFFKRRRTQQARQTLLRRSSAGLRAAPPAARTHCCITRCPSARPRRACGACPGAGRVAGALPLGCRRLTAGNAPARRLSIGRRLRGPRARRAGRRLDAQLGHQLCLDAARAARARLVRRCCKTATGDSLIMRY